MALLKHLNSQGNIWYSSSIVVFSYVYRKILKITNIIFQSLQVKFIKYLLIFRSSRPDVFCKKGILRNFAKFIGKYLCRSLYFTKVADPTLLKQRLFSCEFSAISKKTFSYRTYPVAASVYDHTSDLLLILKICLSVEINFWKTALKITAKTLKSFQGTYL